MAQKIKVLHEYAVALLAGVAVALLWANLAPESFDDIFHADFRFVVNEILMVPFVGIAAVEAWKAVAPGGVFSSRATLVNVLAAVTGGLLGPVGLYLVLNEVLGTPALRSGWGMVAATDIVIAWGAARVIFPPRHPAIQYLLLIAILDDLVGVTALTGFFARRDQAPEPLYLLLVAAGMGMAWGMSRRGIRDSRVYVVLAGGCSWAGLYLAQLHPVAALVFIAPFVPLRKRDKREPFETWWPPSSAEAELLVYWKVVVCIGLFAFGIANAGVPLGSIGPGTWVVFLALSLGKPAGILAFLYLGERLGFPLPPGLRWKDAVVVAVVAGTGFTVAMMMAGEIFPGGVLEAESRTGALFTVASAVLAAVVVKVKRSWHAA